MSFKEKLLADLEKTGVDMTVASKGGEFTPTPKGKCRLRFFSYVELGKQKKTYLGKDKIEDTVRLGFEISGPLHPVREDGKPHVIFVTLSKSLNPKANFFKLFAKMNYAGKCKHFLGLLGEAYRGEIFHQEYTKKDGSKGISVDLRPKGEGFMILPPVYQDEETGETKTVQVEALRTPEQCLLWDRPDLDQWASVFIEGEWAEQKDDSGKVTKPARSKNFVQAMALQATNFKGSALETLLKTNGKALDIPDAEIPETSGDDETLPAEPVSTGDALNGIV